MADAELQGLAVPILHFPTAMGAVVVTFNVNHIDRLRFEPRNPRRHLSREDYELARPRHPTKHLDASS